MYSFSLQAFPRYKERQNIFVMMLALCYTVIISIFDKIQSFLEIIFLLPVSSRKKFFIEDLLNSQSTLLSQSERNLTFLGYFYLDVFKCIELIIFTIFLFS